MPSPRPLPWLFLPAVLASTGEAAGAERPAWPDGFQTRVEALALIETLNADILASRSATLSLERWCATHGLSDEPKIVALLDRGADKPASAEQRRRLQVGNDEPLRYRHVRLACGDRVLSEADNWYVPGRLTAEMNRLLEATDTPFGKAVAALKPYRQTFAVEVLWSPLPKGWELRPAPAQGSGTLDIPDRLFEHHAVLYAEDHRPFSEVDEVYRGDLLAFPLGPAAPR
jgi:hypothetical protein